MRDALINMLAKMAGFTKIPKNQQEFISMVADNPNFKAELQKVENMGIIKRDENGTLNIIDQDRVNGIVSNFLMNLFSIFIHN